VIGAEDDMRRLVRAGPDRPAVDFAENPRALGKTAGRYGGQCGIASQKSGKGEKMAGGRHRGILLV
ncbi:hypothetical protein, partial [Campylobacter coli]|uniref:hypothetical protein n=1 Tax=Campylobacter coli TaxID=195 RepID=UPI001F09C8AA